LGIESISEKYDLAVIGAGPAGYSAAIRAAQLGAKVILIEEKRLGGTCTNVGCIPTKLLLRFVKLLSDVEKGKASGLMIDQVKVDLSRLMQRKNEVVGDLVQGIELLLKSNGVQTIHGRGTLTRDKRIEVTQNNGSIKIIDASKIMIATGSKPLRPKMPGIEGKNVFFDEDASDITKIPSTLVIAGGGPVGIELAYVYSKLGSKVTVLEMMPRILPREDHEIAQFIRRRMVKDGIKVENDAKVISVEDSAKAKLIRFELQGEERTIEADRFLVTLGRTPSIDNLGLETVGVRTVDGKIEVNERMETNIENIYAIGDVAGGAYAHEAMEGGIVAAGNAMKTKEGSDSTMDCRVIPRCFFTMPQIGAVGLLEEEARRQGFDVKVGRFYFAASAAALVLGETEGFVKIVVDDGSQEILGVHIIGPNASELVSEAALSMRLGATYEEIIKTIHAHPTLSETLKEAAMDVEGRSIHKFKRLS